MTGIVGLLARAAAYTVVLMAVAAVIVFAMNWWFEAARQLTIGWPDVVRAFVAVGPIVFLWVLVALVGRQWIASRASRP